MIILSQDKDKILNFNNINMILVRGAQIISFDNTYTDSQDGDSLGIYETRGRAKEVLQEIIEAIFETRKKDDINALFGWSTIPANTYYEMPKE